MARHDGAGQLIPEPGTPLRGVPWPRPDDTRLWRYLDTERALDHRLIQALGWPLSVTPAGLNFLLGSEGIGTTIQLTGLPTESGPDSQVLARSTQQPGGEILLEVRERRALTQRLAPPERIYLCVKPGTQTWDLPHDGLFEGERDTLKTDPCQSALWGAAWMSGHYPTTEGSVRWEGQTLTGMQEGARWQLVGLSPHEENPLGSLMLRQDGLPPRQLSLADGARFLLAMG